MLLLAAALACVDCHKDLVERYARTPMANTSGRVRAAEEFPGKAGRQFTITPDLQLVWAGGRVSLTFYIGSRRMGRSFAFEYQGHLYQAPVGYYANRHSWDLAPGYEHDVKPDLTRPITPDCLFCHSSRATLEPGTLNRYREIVAGIGCARCHGDSADHAKLVNPAKLSARRRDSICEQCHLSGLRIAQPDRRVEDFRPGADLSAFVEVFTPAAKGVSVNGHAGALNASRCKQASGDKLWCGTCHNPHRPTESYAAVCRSCHTTPHNAEDCVPCHMPKAKAYDGGHTVFTDHSISTHPRPGKLASYFGREPSPRNLGLAYVELATKQRDPEYLEKAWPLLRQAAATQPRDPALYYAIANVLNAAGDKQRAIEYYRRSLDQDPLQTDALRKLAALVSSAAETRKLREKALRILPRPQ
jgi:tetratricopeptide repeat protein/cytochrome c554/c'-like protein